MYNGIGGMPSSPIDLLFGLASQPPVKGTADSREFGNLLDLLALTPGEGNGLTKLGLPLAANQNVAMVAPVRLILPQDLAQALDMHWQPAPEITGEGEMSSGPFEMGHAGPESLNGQRAVFPSMGQTSIMDNPEPMIQLRAGLLSVDDGNNQALYLRILPPEAEVEGVTPMPGQGRNEEMVLPMRLRTVELDGNRIIADAELQTATGKDVSIRLRLEIAGNTTQTGTIIPRPGQNPESGMTKVPEQVPLKQTIPNLPRLLHNLNVQAIVIEQTGNDFTSAAKEIMPQVASSLRNLSDIRMPGTRSNTVNPEATGNRMQSHATNAVPTIGRFESSSQSIESGTARNFNDMFMPENKAGLRQASSNVQANTVGFDANNSITIPVSEVGSALPQLDTNSDLSQVRFYNLDQKLDQLKSNPGQKIKIQLVPARLGKMELSVINHRGTVTVQLTLESMQARQTIERNLGQLERHLASSGIRVDNFQLHVNQPLRGGPFAHFQQHYDQSQDGFNNRQDHGRQQYAQDQRQMRRFGLSDNGFAQTMINCLA